MAQIHLFEPPAATVESRDEEPEIATEDSSLFGDLEPISTYTRAEAIADGVLIDLRAACPELCREHLGSIHVACTASVWGIIKRALQNEKYCNDLDGVVHDMLWMARRAIERLRRAPVGEYDYFTVIIQGAGRRKNYQFKIGSSLDEEERPCLTILETHES